MNKLYKQIKLPVDISLPNFPTPAGTYEHLRQYTMFFAEKTALNKDFTNFIDRVGLTIPWIEICYNPPHTEVPIHLDETNIYSGMTKLNLHIGHPSCTVNWYTPLPTSTNQSSLSPVSTSVILYDYQDVNLLSSRSIDRLSIMDVSVPHNLINHSDQPSWVLSMVLHYKGAQLNFDDALQLFDEYIEE